MVKYWLDIDADAQVKRLRARVSDPMKRWKLSPMDVEARRRWHEYTRARDEMLTATNKDHAPWHVVDANDKREARLTIIRHLLSLVPYEDALPDTIEIPDIPQTDHWTPEQDRVKDTINGAYK